MKIVAQITRVVDGETVNFAYDDGGTVEDIRFGWEWGNDSCDCNRGQYFSYERSPESDPIQDDCGTTKYRVKIMCENGEVIYEEA